MGVGECVVIETGSPPYAGGVTGPQGINATGRTTHNHTVGPGHTCGLRQNGFAARWGSNRYLLSEPSSITWKILSHTRLWPNG